MNSAAWFKEQLIDDAASRARNVHGCNRAQAGPKTLALASKRDTNRVVALVTLEIQGHFFQLHHGFDLPLGLHKSGIIIQPVALWTDIFCGRFKQAFSRFDHGASVYALQRLSRPRAW